MRWTAIVCCLALFSPSAAEAKPKDRFLGPEGERLHYVFEGAGCPVVFVGGGSAMDSRQWEEASRALGDGVASIRFDPRGVGRSDLPREPFSDAADLASVLDALGYEQAVIVGNASAGAVALEFALARPDRSRGVVAVVPFIDGWKFSEEMQGRMGRLAAAFVSGAQQYIEAIFADDYFIPAPLDPSARGRARDLIEAGYEKITSSDASLLRGQDTPLIDRIDAIAVPVLLAVGSLDHPDEKRSIEHLDGAIADSRRIEVKGSGHTPTLEAPARLARGIRNFLAELEWTSGEQCRGASGGR